jgi:hypothetical protein
MIANMVEMADAERQFAMGYEAAKRADAAHRDLGIVPYPNLCPAMAGWAKAVVDIFNERQGMKVKWYSAG